MLSFQTFVFPIFMNRNSIHLFLVLLFSTLSPQLSAQTNPETEIRAIWLTTNWQLDWPSNNYSAEAQQKELIDILNQIQQANFNTIFFQVRIRGDVFYPSSIEPMSPFFLKNIQSNYNIPYDPLEFVIKECHKRGIQCHAWFVTFPVGNTKQVQAQGRASVVKNRPDLCKLYRGEWYLDPGNPLTRHYILSLVDEIVSRYDIDGIHFDYIRYPEDATKFPDSDTFRKYAQGQSIEEWRRGNINNIVSSIYSEVKQRKPWVQVSCSPIGRYKALNPRKGTWTAYESVHQDAGLWMEEGIMDAIYPMMYYNELDFGRYVNEWEKKSKGRFVVPGLAAYRLMQEEGNWQTRDLTEQIDFIRSNFSSGMAFYRAGNILNNTKNIKNIIRENYFKYPAKLPPMTWLKTTPPSTPINLKVYKEGEYVAIEWNASNNEQQTYTLYESYYKGIDTKNPQNIVMTRINGNKIYLKAKEEEVGVYYTVTATDRYNNESFATYPAFYILSPTLEK